jgi:CheY-like chemotaxis protein
LFSLTVAELVLTVAELVLTVAELVLTVAELVLTVAELVLTVAELVEAAETSKHLIRTIQIIRMSILYVDDDLEDIEIFHEAVKAVDPSVQCLTANSGKDALVFLNTCDRLPNHIVLDINMPGMDGKQCLQEIRRDKKFDGINIIIYSTNGFPNDIREIQSLGARFIKKANSFNDLCGMIEGLVLSRR